MSPKTKAQLRLVSPKSLRPRLVDLPRAICRPDNDNYDNYDTESVLQTTTSPIMTLIIITQTSTSTAQASRPIDHLHHLQEIFPLYEPLVHLEYLQED